MTEVQATSAYLNLPLRTKAQAKDDISHKPQRNAYFHKYPRLTALTGTIYKGTSQEWICECCGVDMRGEDANRIGQMSSSDIFYSTPNRIQSVVHACDLCFERV